MFLYLQLIENNTAEYIFLYLQLIENVGGVGGGVFVIGVGVSSPPGG